MVIAVKIPSLPHQNLSHYDVDLPIFSLDFVPNLGYPLRFGEIIADARCNPPLIEP